MPISIWNSNIKEVYIGGQKIKEIYIGREKVYGGKTVTEYYFRNQEDIKRALKDQIWYVQEYSVRLFNNKIWIPNNARFALPIGIENPKMIEIKGVIKGTDFYNTIKAMAGIWNYNRGDNYIYNGIGMFVVNGKIIVYNITELIEISNRGVTDIDFTLTFTYIGFEYVWTIKMLKYSIKATGVMYNNYNNYYNNKSFTIEGIQKYDVLPLHFVFYPEDSSEIQIEYFKAQ